MIEEIQFDTLDNVVNEYLLEAQLGEAEYTRSYHIASRGLRELAIDLPLYSTEVTNLWIEPNGLGELPQDCLKVLRIARNVGGNLVSLTNNPDLPKMPVRGYNRDHHHHNNIAHHPNNVYGQSYFGEESLGRGSWNNVGEYFISGNTVYLSPELSHCKDEIYVEYKCFPKDEVSGEPYVHPYVKEALIAFIRWTYAINRKNQDKWDKQEFKGEWLRQKKLAKYRMKAPIKQELNQYARQSTKLGIKS